jgi:hypothetical protein
MSDSNIRNFFKNNVPGGLEKYLVGLQRDIEEIEQAGARAKAKLDFIKMVEQILCTLDHLATANEDKEVIFNFDPVTREEIDEHWKDD